MLKPRWVFFPESGWLHAWKYDLTDAMGRAAPRGTLHHFKVLDPEARELFSDVMLHVLAAGEETTPGSLPRELGYRVEAGDSLLVTAMLHNTTDEELRGLRLTITIGYSPNGSWRPPLNVVPFFAHVSSDWQSVSYDLPPGRSTKSVDIVSPIEGRILGLSAHLHRWGATLVLQSLPDGRVVWEARASAASDGTILEIPRSYFVWSNGLELNKGRAYRLTASYDNPTDSTIVQGGMATLVGIVAPEEPWPEVDRTSDEYIWYLTRELQGGGGHHPPPMQHR